MELIGKRFTNTNNKNTGIIVNGPYPLGDIVVYIVVFDNGNVDVVNARNITLYHYNPEPIVD